MRDCHAWGRNPTLPLSRSRKAWHSGTMEEYLKPLTDHAVPLWDIVSARFQTILLPYSVLQLEILLGCFVLAVLLRLWLSPKLIAWLRAREGWPKWRLRLMLTVHQRLQLVFFAVLSWASVGIMAQVYVFPSRRYLLVLVATIAMAWLVVSVASRLVRNRLLRGVVTWGLGIYVTLYFLGLSDAFAEVLDEIAIQFGDFRLSTLAVLKALVVTGILLIGARGLSATATRRINENQEISPSMQVLIVKVLQMSLYGAAFFIGVKAIGFDLTGLAVLSGAIGVGLGFGLQKVVSNLVSGVIILLDKSVKPGDVISIGDTFGWINALSARYTSVVTRDGREYLIPNEDLITGQVVNWSHSNEFVRLDIHFGTSYGDDPHKVREVAIQAASQVKRVLAADTPPVCHITGFGDSSVDYILRFWIRDPTAGLTNVRGNVYLSLWDMFRENNITLPFPQREVRVLNDATKLLDD